MESYLFIVLFFLLCRQVFKSQQFLEYDSCESKSYCIYLLPNYEVCLNYKIAIAGKIKNVVSSSDFSFQFPTIVVGFFKQRLLQAAI